MHVLRRWVGGALLGSLAFVAANVASAKPPDLPAKPDVEGRVPLFPLGEEFREGTAARPQPNLPTPKPERPNLPVCLPGPPFGCNGGIVLPEHLSLFQLLLPALEY